ncbi:MAG: 3-hydroxyacyl-CoA dehydrogenase [Synechococcus sp. TMED187]|nr:MAG: 3-hydroxyacyl-CoA dehydrogenase [Synechococcus sp. TMED187]
MSAPSNGLEAAPFQPVVIVGGGFAGLTLALKLSRQHPRPPIVLVEPREQFAFLPLLYELLSGELQPWEVAPRYDTLLNSSGISLIKDRVNSINWQSKTVMTASGQNLSYGQLVLATGSKPNDFGIPGVSEHALHFHSLADVSSLRQRLRTVQRLNGNQTNGTLPALIIVGAGATGVELACKLADLVEGRVALHLIEQGDQILPLARAFNREQAEASIRHKGIQCHLNARVETMTDNSVTFTGQGRTTTLAHHGLIWTAGTRSSRPTLTPELSETTDRLAVDASLRSLSIPDCLVIGDLAMHSQADTKTSSWPSTAQVAMQQGEAAAATVMAMRQDQAPKPFHFNDLGEMLSLGKGNATVTGMGLTMAGPLAFNLRRLTYLARLPKASLGLRSAGAWLLSR